MHKDPIQALFGQYRRDVLAVLLLRPDEDFHTRELARLTGIPVGSLARELKTLVEGGIVLREKQGNQVRYQANRACPVFEELASLFRKSMGAVLLLQELLAPQWEAISLAVIFGSVAKGSARPESDLDILLVTDLSLREVVRLLAPLKESVDREINPVVMTPAKFAAGLARKERLLQRIKEEPKIFAKGQQDDFEKPGQGGPA